ncbi:hypothetical protein EVAR_5538_1 [Eumeta japonica]|uniref:Uncharacterized protein n=1 Tax=Eumeta variegata TaxID=151549 RepID=A0A4C1TA15_EUMVA|nr:hypothetical protein EVAR_5538_1 [Eumeta japonica]
MNSGLLSSTSEKYFKRRLNFNKRKGVLIDLREITVPVRDSRDGHVAAPAGGIPTASVTQVIFLLAGLSTRERPTGKRVSSV